MHRFTKGFMKLIALTLILVLTMGSLCVAHAEIKYAGYLSLRLLDGEPTAGTDARYKLTIRKAGQVTAVLTNRETGVATTVLNAKYGSAQNILLTVPGSLIEDNHNYILEVKLVRGNTIGRAVHTFSTMQVVARVDALSVTSAFQPQNGELLTASFSLPFDSNVTAVIKNSSGAQVAVLANNASYKAGAHALTWSGLVSESTIAPGGRYTVEVSCSNKSGSSPVASASFQITGDTSGILSGRVQGTIQSILLPAQPKDGEKPSFTIRATHTGNYILKIKDVTTGRSQKFTGTLTAGVNVITPNLVCEGGHEYLFQMAQQVSGKTAGKAQMSYTAHMDPPSISVSIPATLKAGYGAAMPITFTTGTSGPVILYITDQTNSTVFASLQLGHQPKGTQTVYWNGLGDNGSLLASDTYHVFGESFNSVGRCYSNVSSLSYEGANGSVGTPVTQGVITLFGAAENPEPVERTPVNLRYQASAAGTLKITLRDMTNNGQPIVVYNGKTAAGARTITIPGDYFGVSTYELKATLTVDRKTVGKAVAYVKPYLVMPSIDNFSCTDTFESEWGSSYAISFDTASTGYLYVRIEKGTSGQFVRLLESGAYTAAGHHTYYWDGRDDAGNMVEPGDYRVNVCYIDSYGNYSNFAFKQINFTGNQTTAEGVYGYTAVGVGNHKTPIKVYNAPNGRVIATTYGISATFNVLKDLGDWLYVETSAMTGGPFKGYVQSSLLQKVALTSPYRIEVNISRTGSTAQTLFLYKDGQLIDQFKISSGRIEGTTPTGTFCLLNRKPYFTVGSAGAICYDALRVVGGVCIHRIPMIGGSYSSTERALGSPASAGCVRVPIEKSIWLYENIPDTTLINIYRSAR